MDEAPSVENDALSLLVAKRRHAAMRRLNAAADRLLCTLAHWILLSDDLYVDYAMQCALEADGRFLLTRVERGWKLALEPAFRDWLLAEAPLQRAYDAINASLARGERVARLARNEHPLDESHMRRLEASGKFLVQRQAMWIVVSLLNG